MNNDPSITQNVIGILNAIQSLDSEQVPISIRHLPSFYLAAIYHFGGGGLEFSGTENKEIHLRAEAVRYYKNAVEINPSHSDSLNNLGKLYNDEGDVALAIEYYRRAREVDALHIQSRINLGLVLHRLGEFAEAVVVYEEARLIQPISEMERSEINYNLGVSYQFMGEVLQAVDCYRLAIGAKLEISEEVSVTFG